MSLAKHDLSQTCTYCFKIYSFLIFVTHNDVTDINRKTLASWVGMSV